MPVERARSFFSEGAPEGAPNCRAVQISVPASAFASTGGSAARPFRAAKFTRPNMIRATTGMGLLDDLQLESDHFAANHETEVILPEAAEAARMIHQELEAEQAPELQERDMNALLHEMRGGVVVVFLGLVGEKPEREAGEMPAMRRAAIRGVVGIMRRDDLHLAAGACHAMDLGERGKNIFHFLDHVDQAHLVECAL